MALLAGYFAQPASKDDAFRLMALIKIAGAMLAAVPARAESWGEDKVSISVAIATQD